MPQGKASRRIRIALSGYPACWPPPPAVAADSPRATLSCIRKTIVTKEVSTAHVGVQSCEAGEKHVALRRPVTMGRICTVWAVVLAAWTLHVQLASGHSMAAGQRSRPLVSSVRPPCQLIMGPRLRTLPCMRNMELITAETDLCCCGTGAAPLTGCCLGEPPTGAKAQQIDSAAAAGRAEPAAWRRSASR